MFAIYKGARLIFDFYRLPDVRALHADVISHFLVPTGRDLSQGNLCIDITLDESVVEDRRKSVGRRRERERGVDKSGHYWIKQERLE